MPYIILQCPFGIENIFLNTCGFLLFLENHVINKCVSVFVCLEECVFASMLLSEWIGSFQGRMLWKWNDTNLRIHSLSYQTIVECFDVDSTWYEKFQIHCYNVQRQCNEHNYDHISYIIWTINKCSPMLLVLFCNMIYLASKSTLHKVQNVFTSRSFFS